MKIPVHDDLVREYIRRLKVGEPLGQVFPCRMSECAFTTAQQAMIGEARKVRKQLDKAFKPKVAPAATQKAQPAAAQTPRQPSKLEKLLYLQHGRCFFCGEPLKSGEASIEHLNPKSHGGTNADENLVACHKSLNQTLGAMSLKNKLTFILQSAGKFKCPQK